MVVCQYCGKQAEAVCGDVIYPYLKLLHDRKYWFCRDCDAYVGTHFDTGEPLGSLANKELRTLRLTTHKLFDKLWKLGTYTRTEAYQWLQAKLGLTSNQCHIGKFDVSLCEKTIEALNEQITH